MGGGKWWVEVSGGGGGKWGGGVYCVALVCACICAYYVGVQVNLPYFKCVVPFPVLRALC